MHRSERCVDREEGLRAGFDAGSFDACFSSGAFEHSENGIGDCRDEARRILKPGGWLFVSVPFQNWRRILRDAGQLENWDEGFAAAAGNRQPHRFYQCRFTRPELRRELELHGFRAEVVTADPETVRGRALAGMGPADLPHEFARLFPHTPRVVAGDARRLTSAT